MIAFPIIYWHCVGHVLGINHCGKQRPVDAAQLIAGDLAMQGAVALATMILSYLSRNLPVSVSEWLVITYIS